MMDASDRDKRLIIDRYGRGFVAVGWLRLNGFLCYYPMIHNYNCEAPAASGPHPDNDLFSGKCSALQSENHI